MNYAAASATRRPYEEAVAEDGSWVTEQGRRTGLTKCDRPRTSHARALPPIGVLWRWSTVIAVPVQKR
jgi:hypothetical protein